MTPMEPLIDFTITHEYFETDPSEVFNVKCDMDYRKILGGPRFPFIHRSQNKWTVVGNPTALSECLSNSPDGLKLELEININDPSFLYYTKSGLPEISGDNDIQITPITSMANRVKVTLSVSEKSLRNSFPLKSKIRYKTLEKHWSFLLIPRNPDNNYKEESIGMEDASGTITFNTAKRIRWMDKEIFQVTTSLPIKLKDFRSGRNSPDISIYEIREYGKRAIYKRVPPPEPGRFMIKELQPYNEIIQIIYI